MNEALGGFYTKVSTRFPPIALSRRFDIVGAEREIAMPLMNPGHPGMIEASKRYYTLETANDLSDQVRNVCRVALGAVGRQKWDSSHTGLNKASRAINYSLAMNCYSAVVYWGMLGGGLSKGKLEKYVKACNKAGTPAATNSMAQRYIYDRKRLLRHGSGAYAEPGAMVFHGRPDNPIAHVTMAVGNHQIVSCWALQYAASKSIQSKVTDLANRGWGADTALLPIDAFGTGQLEFTDGPFWEQW